ncbi:MAG: hypothetical protein KKG99_12935 [Bacteroidetes bacterium]|nr:hypothetical protein [Bacteroidota bacterium]
MGIVEKYSEFEKISLRRTGCMGTCPVYLVEIYSNGKIEYEGENFVKKTGHHSWLIDSQSIKALNKAIHKYNYFTIKPKKIEFEVTCNPSCITSIQLKDGKYREIENYYGNDEYPKILQRLEKRIENIIGIENYIGANQ